MNSQRVTDEELQRFAGERVRLVYDGHAVTGKLIAGFEAQLSVKAPYAIEWADQNESLGTNEVRRVAIHSAEAVASVELLDEAAETDEEIQDVAEEEQTPG